MRRERIAASLGLAGFLGASFLVALSGSRFRPGAWYEALSKPAWTPPDWVFPPVWTALYAGMAIAAWLVWRRRGESDVRWALGAWGLQLALNAVWSPVFFGAHQIGAGLAVIVALWFAIAATIASFHRHSRAAAALLLPYLVWVSYAAALNFALLIRNG